MGCKTEELARHFTGQEMLIFQQSGMVCINFSQCGESNSALKKKKNIKEESREEFSEF